MQPCCNVTNAKVVPKQLGERGELRIYAFEKNPIFFRFATFHPWKLCSKLHGIYTIKPGTLKQGTTKHRTLTEQRNTLE